MFDITGDGTRTSFNAHGLRETSITNRFEAGLEAESIAIVTGHRQPDPLKAYQSSRGALDQQLQKGALATYVDEFSAHNKTESPPNHASHCNNDGSVFHFTIHPIL